MKTLQMSDSVLSRFQDNVKEAVGSISRVPILDGLLVEGISLTTGIDNNVAHKLGRIPRMWIVADRNANSTVWRTAWDDSLIALRCSANVTISLWVA